jgi:hypothetical protein
MKKYILLFILVQGLSNAYAQYGDYFRRYDIYGGLQYMETTEYIYAEKYPRTPSSPAIYDTVTSTQNTPVGPFVGVGLNLPFAIFANDNMSIGAHIAANIAIVDGISLNVPIGIQYRFGTDASLNADTDFGFSIGAGYNIFGISGDSGEGIFKFPYLSPEINFATRNRGLIKIKAYLQFTEQQATVHRSTETGYTRMRNPIIITLAICPNFD